MAVGLIEAVDEFEPVDDCRSVAGVEMDGDMGAGAATAEAVAASEAGLSVVVSALLGLGGWSSFLLWKSEERKLFLRTGVLAPTASESVEELDETEDVEDARSASTRGGVLVDMLEAGTEREGTATASEWTTSVADVA